MYVLRKKRKKDLLKNVKDLEFLASSEQMSLLISISNLQRCMIVWTTSSDNFEFSSSKISIWHKHDFYLKCKMETFTFKN